MFGYLFTYRRPRLLVPVAVGRAHGGAQQPRHLTEVVGLLSISSIKSISITLPILVVFGD